MKLSCKVCKFFQILQTLFAKGPVNVLVGWAQEIYGIGRLGLWSRRQFLWQKKKDGFHPVEAHPLSSDIKSVCFLCNIIAGMLFHDIFQLDALESHMCDTAFIKDTDCFLVDHGQTGISPVVVFIQ